MRLRRTDYDVALLAHHLTLPGAPRKYRVPLTAISSRTSIELDNGHSRFLDARVLDNGFGSRHEGHYVLVLAAALGASVRPHGKGVRVADLGCKNIAPAPFPAAGLPLVAIHPGSGTYSVARRWPPGRFAEAAAALQAGFGARVVLIGGPGEHDLVASVTGALGSPGWVSAVYPSTPRALAEVLSGCTLFIGNDSYQAP